MIWQPSGPRFTTSVAGVTLRSYKGDESQTPDPLIVAHDGDAPAYRGLAYVVFERIPLADFGNRIPQLSFEVMRPLGRLVHGRFGVPFGIDYQDPWVAWWSAVDAKYSRAWWSYKLATWLEPWSVHDAALITGMARLNGHVVGVLANNPMVRAGAVDSASAEKQVHFMELCDQFGIPLLMLCDTPGFLVGPEAERSGISRRSARFVMAGAAADA